MFGRILYSSFALVFTALAAIAPYTAAHARPALETEPGEAMVSLAAGGQVSVPISAYCINFGEPFPGAVTVSSSRAGDAVVKVMKAAAKDGSGTSNVLQTQIAIWHAIEGQWGYQDKDVDMTVAKALDTASISETTGALRGGGLSLDQALTEGKVQATVEGWKVVDAPKALSTDAPYYGSGTLVLKNLTDAKLDLYVPLGLVLKAAIQAEQDMAVYAVSSYDMAPKELPKTGAADGGWPLGLLLLTLGLSLIVLGLGMVARRRTAITA